MSKWYVAQVCVGPYPTDYTGSGLSHQEAIDNMGLDEVDLEVIEGVSKLLGDEYSIRWNQPEN
jgi:hypothetical protein